MSFGQCVAEIDSKIQRLREEIEEINNQRPLIAREEKRKMLFIGCNSLTEGAAINTPDNELAKSCRNVRLREFIQAIQESSDLKLDVNWPVELVNKSIAQVKID